MKLLIISSIAGLFVLYLKYGAAYLAKRKFQKMPSTPFNLFKDKMFGKLHGIAMHNEALVKAPFSGQACLCYYIVVEEKRWNRWQTTIRTVWGKDFMVQCDGGQVMVRMGAMVPYFTESYSSSGSISDPEAKARIEHYLNRSGKTGKGTGIWGYGSGMRFKETILFPGDEVEVMGIGHWKNKNTPQEYLQMRNDKKSVYLTNIPSWIENKG